MPYRWEPSTGVSGRYRDERGRFVASSTVRRELDRYLDNSDPAKALAEALRGRQLSVADWEVAMRRHVKNTHLNAIAMERGGYANMRPQDYGRVGQIVREQYGYLRGFANDIASGKQRLDGTLGVRAKLYTQAGRESFYRSKQANLQPGIDMVRSIKHARDSCRDCEYLNGKWFKVGDPAYSLPGRRQCNKNCRCTEEYGRQTADGVEVVEDGTALESIPGSAGAARKIGMKSTYDFEAAKEARQRLAEYDQELKKIDRDEAKETAAILKRQERYKTRIAELQDRMTLLEFSDPKWSKLEDEMNATVREMLSVSGRTDWEAIRRQVREQQRQLIYLTGNGARVNFVFAEGLENTYGGAARAFSRMVSEDSGIDGRPIRVETAGQPRRGGSINSYFSEGVVYMRPGAKDATFLHEMGHGIEYWDAFARENAQQFLDRRTRGETPVSLRELTGNNNYAENEVSTPDRFRDAYMGKRMPNGHTEIISMGIEEMYYRPAEFAKEDPDYFDFIFKVLRGR